MFKLLSDVFVPAFEAVAGFPADPMIRRSQRADFQLDGVLPLARGLGRPPGELAQEIAARAGRGEVAGPGFINVTLAEAELEQGLEAMAGDDRLGVPVAANREVIVIDYSGPNVAKEMHVGHLRSTIIGDAAARLLEWLGHDVRRINHLGDWGTPFGMLIEHLADLGLTADVSLGTLNDFYRAARVKFDTDPAFAQRSRQRVVALQSGDEATLRLWRRLVAESEKHFMGAYDRLGVTLTAKDFRGESSYNDRLPAIVEELDRLGLLHDSDGAKCAFPPGFEVPLIVRKRDGGFGYAATDLASVEYRVKALQADRLLYVVGSPQRQHFEMVFAVARQAGLLPASVKAEHIGFGSILGADGKMLKSRAGDTVKLADLLDEAVARTSDPAIGIGAIKYADLSNQRIKDYVFDWDRMLAANGNTAAYLQYACARINSIRQRDPRLGPIQLSHPAERALALELLCFPQVLQSVAESLEFQKLTTYLFGLAGAFTVLFDRCRVVGSPSRLALSALTRRVLVHGLDLLGISVPDRM